MDGTLAAQDPAANITCIFRRKHDRPHDKGIDIINWNAILEEGKKY